MTMVNQKEAYTFAEIKEKYGWSTEIGATDRRIAFARKRGIIIEFADKIQGKSYFHIVGAREAKTFREIAEQFNWDGAICQNDKEKIKYAQNRGVTLIKLDEKLDHASLFVIQEVRHPDEEWKPYPNLPYYEVTPTGLVRIASSGREVGYTNSQGYRYVTYQEKGYPIHRMVMETFSPIDNSELYVVDHINGIKTDNRVENLRWLTKRQNAEARDENYAKLNANYQKLIETFGYEKTNQIFEELLRQRPPKESKG